MTAIQHVLLALEPRLLSVLLVILDTSCKVPRVCSSVKVDSMERIDCAFHVILHARFATKNPITNVSRVILDTTLTITPVYLALRSVPLALGPYLHNVSPVH